MVVRDAHANLSFDLKSSIRRHHLYRRRFQRVLFWKCNSAHVVAAIVATVFQTPNNVIPNEYVVGVGTGYEIINVALFALAELAILYLETLGSYVF